MKIHTLTCNNSGEYQVILHTPMATGNNLIGLSWKNIWLASGSAKTSMTVGTGIGQISSAESAQILAGDVIELSAVIPVNVVKQGAVAVNVFADAIIASRLADMQNQYSYYGWTN